VTPATAPVLTPLEIASGVVLGVEEVPHDDTGGPAPDPLAALEAAIRAGLERPPCLVSFSGGRDSSAVLAVATRLAEREGLPLPIPVTNAFPGAAGTDEAAWQQEVVRRLGLGDWVVNRFDDELDVVGPLAAEALRDHGLLWPFNAHFAVPLVAAAAGGTLLTGLGGDELLGASQWGRLDAVVSRRARPAPRDLLRAGLALAPTSVRAARAARREDGTSFPWLVPAAERRVLAAWWRQSAGEPARWTRRFRWVQSVRYLRATVRSLELIGRKDDVVVAHPFTSSAFANALAQLPRGRRFHSRAEAMRSLFGQLLPEAVLARVSKASFDAAFFNRHSRAFVARWDGEGTDPDLVDRDRLRGIWQSESPDARSFLLLQHVWLRKAGKTV